MGQYERVHARSLVAAVDIPVGRFVNRAGGLGGPGVIGVSEHAARTGEVVSVVTGYSAAVQAAEMIAVGDFVDSDALGRAIVARAAGIGVAEGAAQAGFLFEMRCGFGALDPAALVTFERGPGGGIEVASVGASVALPNPRFGDLRAARRLTGHTGSAAANEDRTWETQFAFPADVIAIQLVYPSWFADDYVNCVASVRAVDSVSDTARALIPVTFGGAPTFTIKGLVSGGGGTVNQETVQYTVSDVIPVASVPRADGRAGGIIAVRTYVPLATNATRPTVAKYASGDSIDLRQLKSFYGAGNLTGAGSEAASMTATYINSIVNVVAYTRQRTVTVMCVGDSIANGTGNVSSSMENGADIAVRKLQGEGFRFDIVNMGFASMYSHVYLANGIAALDIYRPTIAFYAVGSPNDTDRYTESWFAACMSRAVRWIDECKSRGVIPGLMTMAPQQTTTAPQEVVRRRLVTATMDLAVAAGIPAVDRSIVWTNYDSATGGYLTGYNFDNTHPSNAGYHAEGEEWLRVLRQIQNF